MLVERLEYARCSALCSIARGVRDCSNLVWKLISARIRIGAIHSCLPLLCFKGVLNIFLTVQGCDDVEQGAWRDVGERYCVRYSLLGSRWCNRRCLQMQEQSLIELEELKELPKGATKRWLTPHSCQ